jgi:hypothetical protein
MGLGRATALVAVQRPRWRETAFVYAWLVDLARQATPPTP